MSSPDNASKTPWLALTTLPKYSHSNDAKQTKGKTRNEAKLTKRDVPISQFQISMPLLLLSSQSKVLASDERRTTLSSSGQSEDDVHYSPAV
jgi:hypothetical protein